NAPLSHGASLLDGSERKRAEGIRLAHAGRPGEMARLELAIGCHAEETERDADLLLEEFQGLYESRRAGRRKPQTCEPADADGLRAERNRLDNVGAAHETAVDPHLGFAFDCLNDLRQHRRAPEAMVELTAPMVRDVDDLHAVLDAEFSVLRS